MRSPLLSALKRSRAKRLELLRQRQKGVSIRGFFAARDASLPYRLEGPEAQIDAPAPRN